MNLLYLIDYSNFCYKFSSVYNLTRKVSNIQVDVSVLYGWYRALKANPFSDIVICLDGYPKYHLSKLASYKGTRSHEAKESVSVPRKEIIEALVGMGALLGKNISVAFIPFKEADQVIASFVHIANRAVSESSLSLSKIGYPSYTEDRFLKNMVPKDMEIGFSETHYDNVCIIGTTDSDIYQLCAFKDVYIDSSTSGKNVNYSNGTPKAVDNISPHLIALYKAIIGDHSDNIPPLSISIPRKQVYDIISKLTPEEVIKFEQQVNMGVKDTTDIGKLRTEIIGCLQQFKDNLFLTRLSYSGYPSIIQCDKSKALKRTKSILDKYKIKYDLY